MNKRGKSVRKKHRKKHGKKERNEVVTVGQTSIVEVFTVCVIAEESFPMFMRDFKESFPGQYGRMEHSAGDKGAILIKVFVPAEMENMLQSSVTEGCLSGYYWGIMYR